MWGGPFPSSFWATSFLSKKGSTASLMIGLISPRSEAESNGQIYRRPPIRNKINRESVCERHPVIVLCGGVPCFNHSVIIIKYIVLCLYTVYFENEPSTRASEYHGRTIMCLGFLMTAADINILLSPKSWLKLICRWWRWGRVEHRSEQEAVFLRRNTWCQFYEKEHECVFGFRKEDLYSSLCGEAGSGRA